MSSLSLAVKDEQTKGALERPPDYEPCIVWCLWFVVDGAARRAIG